MVLLGLHWVLGPDSCDWHGVGSGSVGHRGLLGVDQQGTAGAAQGWQIPREGPAPFSEHGEVAQSPHHLLLLPHVCCSSLQLPAPRQPCHSPAHAAQETVKLGLPSSDGFSPYIWGVSLPYHGYSWLPGPWGPWEQCGLAKGSARPGSLQSSRDCTRVQVLQNSGGLRAVGRSVPTQQECSVGRAWRRQQQPAAWLCCPTWAELGERMPAVWPPCAMPGRMVCGGPLPATPAGLSMTVAAPVPALLPGY